jgi:hypothetical protein
MVTPLCYAIGFRKDSMIVQGTISALMILTFYAAQQVLVPDASAFIRVFAPGSFWLGSLVAFTGLLIMSNKWFLEGKELSYGWMQLIATTVFFAGVAYGMIFGVSSLAGIAGTFLVLFFVEKLLEVPADGMIGFGFKLMMVGGFLSGVWWFAMQNEEMIMKYLTMTV